MLRFLALMSEEASGYQTTSIHLVHRTRLIKNDNQVCVSLRPRGHQTKRDLTRLILCKTSPSLNIKVLICDTCKEISPMLVIAQT